ncbi:MAG: hypothetical protein AAF346_21360 [Pseudomonadota bacterium]
MDTKDVSASSPPSQLTTKPVIASTSAPPPAVGSVPVAVLRIAENELKRFKSKLGGLLAELFTRISEIDSKQGNRAKAAARKPGWKDEATELLAVGIIHSDQGKLMEFCQKLFDDLGVPMPETGALWSDPNVGQVQAKEHLDAIGGGAKVLADTPLGKMAMKMKLPPSRGTRSDDTIETFAERNKAGLTFWGAISAAYTSQLRGDVHVFLPKGITVGSIFWNDELPVLQERRRNGEVNNIYFHLQDPLNGQWSAPMGIDDISIIDAYAADRFGANKGAESLASESTEEEIRATMGRNYQVELKRPVSVKPLREGFNAALQRARERLGAPGESETVKRVLMAAMQRRREKIDAEK